MKLSSLDIRKQQFSRIVRGYDRDEVDAFLEMVGTQWQEMVDDLRRAEEKLSELQVQLEHYQKVEEALEEAIKSARASAEKKLENAEKSAAAVLEKAEARAVQITMEAEEARLKAKRETAKYSLRQKEMLTKFKAFLNSELEMLSYHEKHDTFGISDRDMPQLTRAEVVSSDEDAATEEAASFELAEEKAGNEEVAKPVAEANTADDADEARPAENQPAAEKDTREVEEKPSSKTVSEELAENAVSGDSAGSTGDGKDEKPAWTVNTLVSPDKGRGSGARDADKPSGKSEEEMKAAQEEIDNLRKLLKDLE